MAKPSAAVETAKNYYDSADADTFYALIWGGEDIHIGLYQGANDDIAAASQRTIAHMAKQLSVKPKAHILDLGSGFGGATREKEANRSSVGDAAPWWGPRLAAAAPTDIGIFLCCNLCHDIFAPCFVIRRGGPPH